ncbi:helicase-related protein [Paramagnetospirillum kuznetsovii]|uniref:helicase-related protein n=1 Tax=Paramagnetospirillum kuznetsovii TaxID=2053833 RepID=UPI001EFDC805|nr:helicase-related protein [Paramagnetospirillum kuznetsovii]
MDTLARKLERQLKDDRSLRENLEAEEVEEISTDFEGLAETADEWVDDEEEPALLSDDDITAIEREIADLRAFRNLAVSVTENAKGLALLNALSAGFSKTAELGGAEKAIIFTESRRTQEYLVQLLVANGYEGKIVLFNGTNADPQSRTIYDMWVARNKDNDKVTGSRTADMRAALVEHFRDTASIMIATEAAAEGINLQFCSMVVNYDLPWNPQRIEQRIGRCHRYGQKYDVVVINFLNKNNAADIRVHQLLAEKFKLFSGVFGASDEVLGAIESGVDFEKRIVAIYQTCRTTVEIESAFTTLQAEMDEQIKATMDDTRRKLLENFDAEVHDRLKINLSQSREYIGRYEHLLWMIARHELSATAVFDDAGMSFELSKGPSGVSVPMGHYHFSKDEVRGHRLRLGHPLAQHVLKMAAERPLDGAALAFDYSSWGRKAAAVEPMVGKAGTLIAHRLSVTGSDEQDHIILAAVIDGGKAVDPETARRLFELPCSITGHQSVPAAPAVTKSIEKRKGEILEALAQRQSAWFDEEIDKLDKWADDKRAGLKSDLREFEDEIKSLKKEARQTGNLPDKLALQRKIKGVEQKRDEAWREYDSSAKVLEAQKDDLLDQVEERLRQQVAEEQLFSIRFAVQ